MVNKEILRQIVIQQRESLRKEETVRREILDEILGWFKDNRILVLTGIRRCGKSTLLKQIMQNVKKYCYVNFEDERFIDFSAHEFESLNEVLIEVYDNPEIYFFDEIQNIDKFETFVRRLQDQSKKVVITGSNATLMSRELGTRLTGRYKSFEIFPFSFREYLIFKNLLPKNDWFYSTEKKVRLLRSFKEYMHSGGFPEYLKNNDVDYIKTIYENILYRDIISRYSIRSHKILRELVNILITNVSSKITYNSLKKSLGLSNAMTVKEYISYLSNSYLFFELQKFDFSIKKQINAPKKIYSVDPVFSLFAGLNFSDNRGRVLENMVFIELKRMKKDIYYFSGQNECDFVVKDGTKISMAIQVCYNLDNKTKEREVKGLVESMGKFRLKRGLILTREQEDEIRIGNKKIKIVPVFKWMLQNEN